MISRRAGISQSYLSLIELGRAPGLTLDTIAAICEPLGLEPSVKLFPAGRPLRDAAHVQLLERLRPRVNARARWRTEVPLGLVGDLRAWDALIMIDALVVGVEAETRLRDMQALERRVALKKRDGQIARVVLLVSDTRSNRALLRTVGAALSGSFPVPGRIALAALSAGRDPGGDAIVLL
ncbi:MAG: hypothetical protein L0221_11865 [Chloroflexi bacterium]|nr:hypothetical protein [Chloroflexota bacterium]